MNIHKTALFTNPTYNKISSIPIITQIYFWLAYFTFNVLRWGVFYQDYTYSIKSNLIGFPIHITLCYLFVFIFLPKLFQGKVFEFFSLIVLSLSVALLLKFQLTFSFLSEDVLPEFAGITSKITFDYVFKRELLKIVLICSEPPNPDI